MKNPTIPQEKIPLSSLHPHLFYYLGMALLTVIGFWLRYSWIEHPMRYDEAYNVLKYIRSKRWFHYDEPNNHVFNTLLMQASIWVSGYSVTALRFPALLSGVLLIPATGWCAVQWNDRKAAGLLAAGFVATSSILVEYSTNARGYSLVCLTAVVMVALTLKLVKNPRKISLWTGWGVSAVIGLYTIPVMLPAVILSAVLLLLLGGRENFPVLRNRMAGTLFLIGLATAVLYLPVAQASGWKSILSNRWIQPEPLVILPAKLGQLFREFVEISTTDSSWLGNSLMFLGLVGGLIEGLRGKSKIWLLPAIALFLALLFPLLQRRVPPPRADLYILPLLFAAIGVGLVYVSDLFQNPQIRRRLLIAISSLCILGWSAGAWTGQRRDFLIIKEPWECIDAETVVAFVAANQLSTAPNVSLASNSVSGTFYYYYFEHFGKSPSSQISITDPDCQQVYLFIWKMDLVANLYTQIPQLSKLYSAPERVRTFPSTEVFVCRRK